MSAISPTSSTSSTTSTSTNNYTSPFAPAIQFNGVISGLNTTAITKRTAGDAVPTAFAL